MAMTVALATLDCKVMNMERASGYIGATLPELPPQQGDGLRADAPRAYATSKGYPHPEQVLESYRVVRAAVDKQISWTSRSTGAIAA